MTPTLFPKYRSLRLLVLCIIAAGSFAACSGNTGQQQQGDAGTLPPGTGGVAFQLVWQHAASTGAGAQRTPAFNACTDHAIETIAAAVSNGTTTVAGTAWPCSAHEGLILGIPAGTNFVVHVDGVASGSTATTWSGLSSPITVVTGQITSAGKIVMDYIGGDATQPTVVSITPHSNPTGSVNVPVTDRIIVSFDKAMAISTITATNITLHLSDTTSVPGNVRYDGSGNTAAFTPFIPLAYDTQYVLQVTTCSTVTTCITDTAGNVLASDYTGAVTTESFPLDAPAAPSGVTAQPGNGQVTLNWLASNGSTSYNVYYGLSSGVTITNGTLIAGARAPYAHMGLTNNQTYYYLVSAVNGTGETPAASEVSATPVFPTSVPNLPLPPASLTADAGSGQNILSWPAVSGATSYNLYLSTEPIFPDKNSADHVIRGVTSPYVHADLTDGVTYYYIVTSLNAFGESAESMQASGGVGAIQVVW
jgi:hypothetical protein